MPKGSANEAGSTVSGSAPWAPRTVRSAGSDSAQTRSTASITALILEACGLVPLPAWTVRSVASGVTADQTGSPMTSRGVAS